MGGRGASRGSVCGGSSGHWSRSVTRPGGLGQRPRAACVSVSGLLVAWLRKMALSLKQSNAIQAIARAIQDYLPGGGAPSWRGHVTFGTVAASAGVDEFWGAEGSKVPRLVHLLSCTLDHRPQSFERLVVAIVKEGLRYRNDRGRRITRPEMEQLNGHILDVGFKFPDLWDEAFLGALAVDDTERARQNVDRVRSEEGSRSSDRAHVVQQLDALRRELEALTFQENRQAAGLALERLLNRLFVLSDLAPRQPFKLVGEQIDGSFDLDHEVYLLEAKWEQSAVSAKELYVFREKVIGKSAFTRGVFLAMNGITTEAEQAIKTGKQPNFFVVSGHDLMMVLLGSLPLPEFLRRRQRLLAEEAAIVATFNRVVA